MHEVLLDSLKTHISIVFFINTLIELFIIYCSEHKRGLFA